MQKTKWKDIFTAGYDSREQCTQRALSQARVLSAFGCTYPAVLQRYKLDAPLLAAGLLTENRKGIRLVDAMEEILHRSAEAVVYYFPFEMMAAVRRVKRVKNEKNDCGMTWSGRRDYDV